MFCYHRMWYEKEKTDQVITGGVMPSHLSHLSYYYSFHFFSKTGVFVLIQPQNIPTPKMKPFCDDMIFLQQNMTK